VRPEDRIQLDICEYIRKQYPHVVFLSTGSGLKLPVGLAVKFSRMQCGDGLPDLIILHPAGGYHAAAIEIKKDASEVYKKNGEYRKVEHVQDQAFILMKLRRLGYYAVFGFGFDGTKREIDKYLISERRR